MQILIIDLGSQYTLVISRVLRELGIRSVILSPEKAETFNLSNIKGIILSGGDKNVYDIDAPAPPHHIFHEEWRHIPLLGICYGMQYIAHYYGNTVVTKTDRKNYGESYVIYDTDPLTKDLYADVVWASHGDNIIEVPNDFKIIARYDVIDASIAGISNVEKNIWGIQFHPEVIHTLHGKQMLRNFLFDICKCSPDWQSRDIVNDIQNRAQHIIGDNKCVIGFSGGVDSTTLAAILSPVFNKNITGICIDTGGLRKNELIEIEAHAKAANINLIIVRAEQEFRLQLSHTINAEHKRKIFKKEYQRILEKNIINLGPDYKFLIQGSIAPDIIESGAVGNAALIKSHHNVGHKWNGIVEVPLFVDLFKYEVRELACFMELPNSVINRLPFPGPGLFLRVLGAPPTKHRLNIVRDADDLVTNILKSENVYNEISQLIVALVCVNTVGIKGDARTYGPSIVIRAVETQDFMTVKGFQISNDIRRRIASELSKHSEISRVWWDEMDKPPATVEFE
jgi:GMP synthase (glutamine-hydrolysing)